MVSGDKDELFLSFHGRIIDSLGIQMYQSPVAAIAELIANAWDADSTEVDVALPVSLSERAEIVITDNGHGMTFDECQHYYLNVGRNRREEKGGSATPNGRPVLGRKGIGKFAGFGIADVVVVETVSGDTGEATTFELRLSELRGEEFAGVNKKPVHLLEKTPGSDSRKKSHGTRIRLKNLKMARNLNADQFARSMSRRFIISQKSDDFQVTVNGETIPDDDGGLIGCEFDFPKELAESERPDGLTLVGDWGEETLPNGEVVKWRVQFTKDPIQTEEFRGISVYCGVKIAQTPFFFDLSGGQFGQIGQHYMTGTVQADYLDQLPQDVITTERQRITWELSEAQPLKDWGQELIKRLLRIWKERRAHEKLIILNARVEPFAARLGRFPPTERKTVEGAIKKLASIDSLNAEHFTMLSNAVLTAWEGGRLQELISEIDSAQHMDEGVLLTLFAEAQVLNALNVAEAVKAKLSIVEGLEKRIQAKELENAVRNYIADNPWLLSPKWETFSVEKSLGHFVDEAAGIANLYEEEDRQKRIDLVLRAGKQLLVVEFMRPGLTVDWDHVGRFQHYINVLREKIPANTALGIDEVNGLLVADKLAVPAGMRRQLQDMEKVGMECLDWPTLLSESSKQWQEFLGILVARAPNDDRINALSHSPESTEDV